MFTIYHTRGNGAGNAIKLSIESAKPDAPGGMCVEIARKVAGVDFCHVGNAAYPMYDWKNRMIFRLDAIELAKFLEVFHGLNERVNGENGIYQRSAGTVARVIKFEHMIEPCPGYFLEVRETDGGKDERRAYFKFTTTEALAVFGAIEGAMTKIVFGE